MQHFLTSIYNTINQITQGSVLGKLGIAIGAAITAFYTPIIGLIVACFVTSVVDLIYGLLVAKKHGRKIESRKTWRGTLTKLLNEFTIISLARLIEYTIFANEGAFILTGGSAVIITLTEFWSILENLNTLDPTGPWKSLGKFLRKKGEDYTTMSLDLDEKNKDDGKSDNMAD